MAKEVTVKVVGIHNIRTGGDPGRDLEIYGTLGAWVKRAGSEISTPPDQGEEHLVNRPDGLQVSITEGTTVMAGRSVTMTVNELQELWIGGHLHEDDDSSGDDDMGGHFAHFPFAVIPAGEVRVGFHDRDNDQLVEAIYDITVRDI